MQTPPPPPKTIQSNGDYGSPNGSLSRALFRTPNGTPKRTRDDPHSDGEDAPRTPEHNFSFKGMLFSKRGDGPAQDHCSNFEKTSPPKIRRFNVENLKNSLKLPILEKTLSFGNMLGKGSFGKVYEVKLPGSPLSIAVKVVEAGNMSAKALRQEANSFGSPGCPEGVPFAGEDGTYYAFSSIAIPFDRIDVEKLESVVKMTKEAMVTLDNKKLYDAKPENFGFIPRGTPTVQKDENGQPMVGPLTTEDQVVLLDMSEHKSPEDADGIFNPLLDDEALETKEQQAIFRKFKCEMMEALLRNQFADSPEDEKKIVAGICTKFGYRYAGGAQYQPDFLEIQLDL